MTSRVIGVLDHGFVRIVDHMGSDLSVVRAARTSYDAAWRAGEDAGSDAKLIRYLWKHHHTTPFEAVTFSFEVKAPIFVLRQWHRHRTQSYNELSARYKELPEEFYVPRRDLIGKQSASDKQARTFADGANQDAQMDQTIRAVRNQNSEAFKLYKGLLECGWPRELARTVLPVATYSLMFCTMNLFNLFRFLTLRSDPHAQHEIRVYADAMLELIQPIVPVCAEAWQMERAS